MKTSFLRNIRWPLEAASSGWFLLIIPKSMNGLMLSAIARLGMAGSVRVLDGGNRFDAYEVSRQVQGQLETLDRITVSRAFTCYQVLSLLESMPVDNVPFIVLDMLRTFYDESVQVGERKRLLQICIEQLSRLGKATGGIVSIYPPSVLEPEVIHMRELLQASAAEALVIEPSPVAPEPMRLF